MFAVPAALLTRILVRPGMENDFAAWHASMSAAPQEFPGFISTEIRAPTAGGDAQWLVIQHFRSADEMRAWKRSDQCRRLTGEIGLIAKNGEGEVNQFEGSDAGAQCAVTEVIATVVKPEMQEKYRQWAARIHATEARFPGYRGSLLQPPVSVRQNYWTTLVHFATPEQLDNWLGSAERKKLLEEHQALIDSWTHQRLSGPFAGWFPTTQPDREPATTLKQSMLVLLVLFPIVMFELRFLSPALGGLPQAPATFIGNAISVGLIAWPFMPIAIFFLGWWLSPRKGVSFAIRASGYVLIAALYATEIFTLRHLLS